jgi:hypothetical protein
MLAKRIIACLDVKDGRVVKGVHFVNLRDAGDPLENARRRQMKNDQISIRFDERGMVAAVLQDAATVLETLFATILDRQANPRPGSYTARLLDAGQDEILKKIGEEAMGVILAAKGKNSLPPRWPTSFATCWCCWRRGG